MSIYHVHVERDFKIYRLSAGWKSLLLCDVGGLGLDMIRNCFGRAWALSTPIWMMSMWRVAEYMRFLSTNKEAVESESCICRI